jgi:hypothetical protein
MMLQQAISPLDLIYPTVGAIANYTTRVVETSLSASQRQEALKFLGAPISCSSAICLSDLMHRRIIVTDHVSHRFPVHNTKSDDLDSFQSSSATLANHSTLKLLKLVEMALMRYAVGLTLTYTR